MATKKLNEVDPISELKDNECIPVILEGGAIGRIKKSDLYPLATTSTNGLLSYTEKNYLLSIHFLPVRLHRQ